MKIVPLERPVISKREVIRLITEVGGVDINKEPIVVLALRGFYADMGRPKVNDRGIYDDCFAVYIDGRITFFNGNVDPSIYKDGIATIKAGVYYYRRGIHGLSKSKDKQYEAFRPATPGERLPCTRDGQGSSFAIAANIHCGGENGTSSLACQTVPPQQWREFKNLLYNAMDDYSIDKFPYVLLEKK